MKNTLEEHSCTFKHRVLDTYRSTCEIVACNASAIINKYLTKSYDSGRPIPVLVRSPWQKVDLCWFH